MNEVMERPEVVEVAETVVEKAKGKRGPKPTDFSDKKTVAKFLRKHESDNTVSAYYLTQLAELGYVERVEREVEVGRRGRRPTHYILTGKGKGLLALSKNWKM